MNVSSPIVVKITLSVSVFYFRSGEARNPLCHLSESRHKDCEPGEAERVCAHEGRSSEVLSMSQMCVCVKV